MVETEYQQDLIEMQYFIGELNRYIHGAKIRKCCSDDLPEKTEICPIFQMLKCYNYMYNIDIEKYSFTIGIKDDGLKDIILKDNETFEKIIKKIDENESNISLEDIYTAKSINCTWRKSVTEQRNKLKAHLERHRKGC